MVPRAESQYLYPHITGISFKVTLCQRNIYIQNKCLSSYCVAESKASFRVACEQAKIDGDLTKNSCELCGRDLHHPPFIKVRAKEHFIMASFKISQSEFGIPFWPIL